MNVTPFDKHWKNYYYINNCEFKKKSRNDWMYEFLIHMRLIHQGSWKMNIIKEKEVKEIK